MFTPIELQNKEFKKSGMGYEKKDVDAFLKAICSDYESLYRENIELKDRINTLNGAVHEYRSIEKSIQKAMVLAQQIADKTENDAKKSAKNITDEAIVKAQIIVADANSELMSVKGKIVMLVRQFDKYKADFKAMLNSNLDLLSSDSYNIMFPQLDENYDSIYKNFTKDNKDTALGTDNADSSEMTAAAQETSNVNSEETESDSEESNDNSSDAGDETESQENTDDSAEGEIEGQEEFNFVDIN